MADPLFSDARSSLEEAFFRKRDAELIAEMRRREQRQSRKKALAEVSGISNDEVLEELVEHDIHAETLAAFMIAPLVEVAWADGTIQPGERKVLLHAIEEAGLPKEGVAFKLMKQWLTRRPEPRMMKLWQNYTKALLAELPAEAGQNIKQTLLKQARSLAEAAGGFLGLARISNEEAEVLRSLEKAFRPRSK
jgi:hypothetical protein